MEAAVFLASLGSLHSFAMSLTYFFHLECTQTRLVYKNEVAYVFPDFMKSTKIMGSVDKLTTIQILRKIRFL